MKPTSHTRDNTEGNFNWFALKAIYMVTNKRGLYSLSVVEDL